MSAAGIKTISLLLLILLGFIIRGKIKGKEQKDGIRTIILSLALPATIFIALVKIDFMPELIVIPVLALAFNLVIFFLVSKLPVKSFFNIPSNQYKTLILLIPSLAPGLSCFPFILEYSGEGSVALAALADLGNKIFVLIIAYTIAMKWYFQNNREHTGGKRVQLKDVLISLVNEPVNLVIAVAVIMLSFGLSYESLPEFLRISIDKVALLMTPLVLLFIGMSIRLTWQQVKTIFSFLFFRSSIAFLLSGLLLFFFPVNDLTTILLIVVFPQSACSFWPYAHMAAVNQLESASGENKVRTFDLDFAMNVLACSMPFSVILIMIVYTSGAFFTSVSNVLIAAGVFLVLAALPVLIPSAQTESYVKEESVG